MRRYVGSLVFGALLLGIGLAMTSLSFYEYKYVDALPSSDIVTKKVTLTEVLNSNKEFWIFTSNAKVKKIEDNTLTKGETVIDVIYYNKMGDLRQEIDETDDYKALYITVRPRVHGFDQVKKLIDLSIEGLKDKTIYNYSWFFRPVINVYINPSDSENVKIRNY